MVAVYQAICVTAAMFLTGQASNPLAAQMAAQHGFTVDWARWFVAGIVPGVLSLAAVPYLVRRLYPPEISHTPEAREFAAAELQKLGALSVRERILGAVFGLVCLGWATAAWHGLDIGQVALLGSVLLLLTRVLGWDDILNERAAWDIFIWYGGLLQLGKLLYSAGVTQAFAQAVGRWFEGAGWEALLAGALLIYFYAHYAFASITAHILAMYPAFLALLVAQGAPVGLVVYSFACFTNLSAGLTNYGTTPSPMFFGQGYVPFGDWWRIGAAVSVLNLALWGVAGVAWWKLIGIW
jgi:DASS family divalent anion:Na+ symporter